MRHATLCLALLAAAGCAASGPPPCPPAPDPQRLAALPADPLPAGDAARGAALFARECSRCHAPDPAARESRLFRGYPRLDCQDYLAGAPDHYLFVAISRGGPAVGRDELMKPFSPQLSDREIADLVAFLRAGT